MRIANLSTSKFLVVVATLCTACSDSSNTGTESDTAEQPATAAITASPPVTSVTAARLAAADDETANWLTHGRTYDEQRFSPLAEVTTGNGASTPVPVTPSTALKVTP